MHEQAFLNLLRQNGRRVTKVYLARTDNLNDSITPDTDEQNEQDSVEASRSSDEIDEENNTLTYQPSTVDFNWSLPERLYASYFNIQKATIVKQSYAQMCC